MSSGVYAIANTLNGHCYVGSAVNLGRRVRRHRRELSGGNHPNRHLQRAWGKYGGTSFRFVTIATCVDDSDLLKLEQFYFRVLRPEYNVYPVAGSSLGTKHSPETRAKIGVANKGKHSDWRPTAEIRMRMSEAHKGKKHTPGARAKIAAANTGKVLSCETRAKVSAAAMGNKKCVGKILGTEHRARLRAALLGRPLSPAHRAAISAGQLGKKKGPHSPETRAKIGAANRDPSAETRAKMSAASRGRSPSPEARAKMSAAQRSRYEKSRVESAK